MHLKAGGSKYKDVKFFLFAIPFINAFNYYLTYSRIRLNWFLVMTYTTDTVMGWLAWWAARSIIIYLDKKIPYTDRPLKRILIQLVLTTFVGLTIIISLTELVSWIVKGRFAPVSFYLFDIFIFVIWFLVINGIYIGMHYFDEWSRSEAIRKEEKKVRTGGFTVKHGNQNLLVAFPEILGFNVENGYTVLHTTDNRKYYLDKSLDKIESSLPSELFFRLNRQFILHRNALAGFKRKGDGKLDVMVKATGNFPAVIPVSRTRAVEFKNWFQPENA
jgi:LytTr DNA-binding domain